MLYNFEKKNCPLASSCSSCFIVQKNYVGMAGMAGTEAGLK